MADDRSHTGSPDNDLINLEQDYEVRDWAKSLGVSEEQLRQAVSQVGNSAAKVRQHLGK